MLQQNSTGGHHNSQTQPNGHQYLQPTSPQIKVVKKIIPEYYGKQNSTSGQHHNIK